MFLRMQWIAAAVLSVAALAQVIEKNTLGLDGAKRVIAAAASEARRLNASGGVIAVGWAWRPRSSNL